MSQKMNPETKFSQSRDFQTMNSLTSSLFEVPTDSYESQSLLTNGYHHMGSSRTPIFPGFGSSGGGGGNNATTHSTHNTNTTHNSNNHQFHHPLSHYTHHGHHNSLQPHHPIHPAHQHHSNGSINHSLLHLTNSTEGHSLNDPSPPDSPVSSASAGDYPLIIPLDRLPHSTPSSNSPFSLMNPTNGLVSFDTMGYPMASSRNQMPFPGIDIKSEPSVGRFRKGPSLKSSTTSSSSPPSSGSYVSTVGCNNEGINAVSGERATATNLTVSSSPSSGSSCNTTQSQASSSTYGPVPYLRIEEEPTNRIRYRYKSEKGSHGGLTGENNTPSKKTYPSVKIENYRANDKVQIRASLYTNEFRPRPHVHKLMGKNCTDDGKCFLDLKDGNVATFQNLGILFVGKKEVPEILYQRKLDHFRLYRSYSNQPLSESDKQSLREEAEREAKDMNLNSVRICFEAIDTDHNTELTDKVFSRPVANQKSPDSGELKIVRIDRDSGSVNGGDELFLLCEKVNKKEIKVRFFEEDSTGTCTWEDYGSFLEGDVHHQVAIVLRTPSYKDRNITHPVRVFLQLVRPKDGEFSDRKPFTFFPAGISYPILKSDLEDTLSTPQVKRRKGTNSNSSCSTPNSSHDMLSPASMPDSTNPMAQLTPPLGSYENRSINPSSSSITHSLGVHNNNTLTQHNRFPIAMYTGGDYSRN